MKMSIYEKDWLIIDESNITSSVEDQKIHLIKLDFEFPTREKIDEVIDRFPSTNRYIISDNIRFYNNELKSRKKYYVENLPCVGLISFFKKNNKVMLNIDNLNTTEFEFVKYFFDDILKNVEVICTKRAVILEEAWAIGIQYWNGNILVQ